MKHLWICATMLALLVTLLVTPLVMGGGCKKKKPPDDDPGFKGPKVVREMKKAGTWYAADQAALGPELDRYLVGAGLPNLSGRLVGLISPHAGYRFSGPTAAFGFKLLGKQRGVKRVVVMGMSHHHRFRGVSILKVTHYATPFGLVRLDTRTAERLLKLPALYTVERAHAQEHSVEMQMPFLKRVRPSVKILPMLVGYLDDAGRRKMARDLARLVKPGTVFLASSDFTHRGQGFRFEVKREPGESLAAAVKRLDLSTMPYISGLDGNGLMAHCRKTGITMCGRAPTALMLETLKAAGIRVQAKVLHYTTSGHVLKDWRSTVSYLSVALTTTTTKQ
jgi:AmmeMemoRadiSam system protein B